jgi:hypothetical protein
MPDYPLALALEDFVPVLLSLAGLLLVARWCAAAGRGRLALAGALLVGAGGLSKATWKLLVAGWRVDVGWLDELLFPLLAVGFVLLAGAVLQARRRHGSPLPGVLAALVALAATALAFTGGWEPARLLLLVTAVVASTVLSVLLVRIALAGGDGAAAALFALNLTVTYVLAGLARVPDQTVALQWVEQGLNTVSQGAFAVAAWRLAPVTGVERMYTISSLSVPGTRQGIDATPENVYNRRHPLPAGPAGSTTVEETT